MLHQLLECLGLDTGSAKVQLCQCRHLGDPLQGVRGDARVGQIQPGDEGGQGHELLDRVVRDLIGDGCKGNPEPWICLLDTLDRDLPVHQATHQPLVPLCGHVCRPWLLGCFHLPQQARQLSRYVVWIQAGVKRCTLLDPPLYGRNLRRRELRLALRRHAPRLIHRQQDALDKLALQRIAGLNSRA